MTWFENNRKSSIVVGLTLLLPLLLVLYILVDLWVVRQDYQSEIDRLEPRIARMAGLMASEGELKVSAGRLEAQVLSLVYPPIDESGAVSAALQKDVREIMTDSGLSVTNSRILPIVQEESFDRIGLNLTVTGGLDALDAALLEMANYAPLLLIESIDIKPKRMSRSRTKNGKQIVTVSLQVLTLRAI